MSAAERLFQNEHQEMYGEYCINKLREEIRGLVRGDIESETKLALLPAPGHVDADFGMQLAQFAKEQKKNPVEMAVNLKDKFNTTNLKYLENTNNTGPYLNFKVNIEKFGADVISQVLAEGKEFGKEKIGGGKKGCN